MTSIWKKNLRKLTEFKAEFGHTNVPKNYVDKQLSGLVITLRHQRRSGTLQDDRELDLLRLGFDFDPLESNWMEVYNKVLEFYRLNGHASPNRRSENKHERTIAEWVHRMHKMVRDDALTENKVEKLSLINIDGYPSNHRLSHTGLPQFFERMIDRLNSHIRVNSILVHSGMADPVLYDWVLLQQKRMGASLMTPKEHMSLIKTGFTLKKNDTTLLCVASNQ